MDSAQEKGSAGTSAAPPMGGGDVERATIGNPSLRESEPSSKSVAIPSKGKVSPLIHPGNPSRRESESINIPNSTRGNPPKEKSKSTSTSNVRRFKRGGRRMKSPMGKRPGGMSRSNARIHSPSIHLVSQRASALWSKNPLPHLSPHVKCPCRNALIKCLAYPLGN
jgi:hypothetical protein